jgi:hypothetical protein
MLTSVQRKLLREHGYDIEANAIDTFLQDDNARMTIDSSSSEDVIVVGNGKPLDLTVLDASNVILIDVNLRSFTHDGSLVAIRSAISRLQYYAFTNLL